MKAILLSLLLISCGAKTVNKEEKKTDSLVKQKELLEVSESEKAKSAAKTKEQSNSSSTNAQFDFSNGFNFRFG